MSDQLLPLVDPAAWTACGKCVTSCPRGLFTLMPLGRALIGLVPNLIAPLWDINHVLDESSFLGQLSKALFGYNADPSLSEALAYLAYFGALGVLLLRLNRSATSPGSQAEA